MARQLDPADQPPEAESRHRLEVGACHSAPEQGPCGDASGLPPERGAGDAGWLSYLRDLLTGPGAAGRRVHFVGIGGVGQNAIARVLVEAGFPVSGSDLQGSPATADLAGLGARIQVGHRAEQVEGAGLVVISSAVPATNPEVARARELGIPVVKRAEFLGELTRHRRAICVAGTHGKTTTSAMAGLALIAGGLDPTVLVGGVVPALGTGGRFGRGEHLVAEADEFDGSFLRFTPGIAVVTNVEPDHLDFYRDFSAIVEAFRAFVARVPADGSLVVCQDDPAARELRSACAGQVITYGLAPGADWQAVEIAPNDLGGNDFVALRRGEARGRFRLAVPGRHNVANALAAVAVADLCGVEPTATAEALARFGGVRRRLELKGEARGIAVYDDYAHHPTEIVATLRAVRERHRGRLWCVFQPHTINRTRALFDQFAAAFGDADRVLVADIYVPAGREVATGEITSGDLVRAMRHPGAAHVGRLSDIVDRLADEARPGDVVLTMGAGDVYHVGEDLLERLRG